MRLSDEEIERLYLVEKLNGREIADRDGRSHAMIYAILKRMRTPMREKGRRAGQAAAKRRVRVLIQPGPAYERAKHLVEETALPFDAVARETGLTLIQVQAIADGEEEFGAPVPPPAPLARPAKRRVPRPVAPQVARWCGWFLDAGWTLDETARLFDLHIEDLRAAVGVLPLPR